MRESFEIYLREDQWEEMVKMIEQEITRSEAIINKCINHPSFTISSMNTMDKYKLRVKELNEIREEIRDRL